MRGLLVVFAVGAASLSTACLSIQTGDDGGSGTTATTTPSSTATTADASGANCGKDPTGSVTLCEEISLCPNLGVDPTAYAGCGFRLGSASPIDLECVCGNLLCPIGVANSCDDATQLLAMQDALIVCQQASEGRCLALSATTADASASGSSGTCTPACRNECAGVPDCLVACGC
jgi:hypothetical protein